MLANQIVFRVFDSAKNQNLLQMSDIKSISTKPKKEETTPTKGDIENYINEKRIFKMTGCVFDDSWARGLYTTFSDFKHSLYGINLDNISTNPEEIINLINNLGCLENLRNLLIKHADIRDEGLKALSQQEDILPRLGMISFWGSNFTDEGFREFTNCFSSLTRLKYLYLTQTAISDKGAIALAENMKYCKYLKILYLNGTKTRIDGVKAVIENINPMRCLEKVCLMSNRISDETPDELNECINRVKRPVDITTHHVRDEFLYREFEKCGDIKDMNKYCEKEYDDEDEEDIKKEIESEMETDDDDNNK